MKKQIITFLESYIVIWDEMTNSPAYSEYYGGTLTKILQSFCLANNLPMNASADDLLAEIKSGEITVSDESQPCNG